jgi:hypothetical protein
MCDYIFIVNIQQEISLQMDLIQYFCFLAILSDAVICKPLRTKSTKTTATTTTTTVKPGNISNGTNPLSPTRLELIKNSYSELNLLSKTNPSDFIFDFDKAVTGVSRGTGGRTVSATVSLFKFR